MPFSEFENFKLHAHKSPTPIIISSPPASVVCEPSTEETQKTNQVAEDRAKPVQPLKSAMRNKEKRGDPKEVRWDPKVLDNEHKMQPRVKTRSVHPSLVWSSATTTPFPSPGGFISPRPYPHAPEDPANSPFKRHHSQHHQTSTVESPSPKRHSQHQRHPYAPNIGARRDSVPAHLSGAGIDLRSHPGAAPARSQARHSEHQVPPKVPDAPKRDRRASTASPKSPRSRKREPTQNEDLTLSEPPMLRSKHQESQNPLLFSRSCRPEKTETTQVETSKPPPTPRPERLPSPDLPEIECGQFCECCKIQAPYYFPEPHHRDPDPLQKWEYQLENALAYIKGAGKK